MKVFSTAMFITLVLATPNAQANILKEFKRQMTALQNNAVNKVKATKTERRIKGEECTDFSGNWAGVCKKSDGTSTDKPLVITQADCYAITMDGETISLTGFRTSSLSQSIASTNIGGSLSTLGRWDESGEFIYLQPSMHLGLENEPLFLRGHAKERMWLQEGSLITSSHAYASADISGNTQDQELSMNCTYKKQP